MLISTSRKVWLLGLLVALPMSVSAGTEIYVPLGSANAVAVVDAATDRVVAEIPGVTASHGLAVSRDGNFLVAGSLMDRPKGALPPKPEGMSESEHASHHGRSDGQSTSADVKPQTAAPCISSTPRHGGCCGRSTCPDRCTTPS